MKENSKDVTYIILTTDEFEELKSTVIELKKEVDRLYDELQDLNDSYERLEDEFFNKE